MVQKRAIKWKSVQIPDEIYSLIYSYVESGEGGYASVNEYVRQALRIQLRRDSGVKNGKSA